MGDERRNLDNDRGYTMNSKQRNTTDERRNVNNERRDAHGERPDKKEKTTDKNGERSDTSGKQRDTDDQQLCTVKGSCQYTECPMRRHLSGFRPYTNKVLICRFIFKLIELILVLTALILLAIISSKIKDTCDLGYKALHSALPFASAVLMAYTVILVLTVVGFCACSPITRSVDATICILGFFLLGAAGIIMFLPAMSDSVCSQDCKSGKTLLGVKTFNDYDAVSKRKLNTLTDIYDEYDNDYYFFRKKRKFEKSLFNGQENDAKKHSEQSKNNEMFPNAPTVKLDSPGRENASGEGSINAIENRQRTIALMTVKNNGEIIATKNNVSSLDVQQNNDEIYDNKFNFGWNFIKRQLQNWIRNNTQNNKVYDCVQEKKIIRSKANSKGKLKHEAGQILELLSNDIKCGDRVGEQYDNLILKIGDRAYKRTKKNSKDWTPISEGNPKISSTHVHEKKPKGKLNADIMAIGFVCIADAILMKIDIIRMFFCGLYY